MVTIIIMPVIVAIKTIVIPIVIIIILPVIFIMLHDTIHLLIEDTSYVEKCSLDEKVLNAQIAGYEAVIIYNPNLKKAELVLKYSQDENKAIIPALFIDYSNATALKSFHLKNPSYVIIYGRQ